MYFSTELERIDLDKSTRCVYLFNAIGPGLHPTPSASGTALAATTSNIPDGEAESIRESKKTVSEAYIFFAVLYLA